jgi:hypothetical protein
LAKQLRELQLGNKASRDAQFHFTAHRWVRGVTDMHRPWFRFSWSICAVMLKLTLIHSVN